MVLEIVARSDFHLCPSLKGILRGKYFEDDNGSWQDISVDRGKTLYLGGTGKLHERYNTCIAVYGDYVKSKVSSVISHNNSLGSERFDHPSYISRHETNAYTYIDLIGIIYDCSYACRRTRLPDDPREMFLQRGHNGRNEIKAIMLYYTSMRKFAYSDNIYYAKNSSIRDWIITSGNYIDCISKLNNSPSFI